jgi:uncharacterized protein YfaS (alpha-2-macroglobulin family)
VKVRLAVASLSLTAASTLALALSCGGGQAIPSLEPLHVLSFTPRGAIDLPLAPVRVAFDKPVVAASQVGKPVDPATIRIEPAVEWTGVWRDRQTVELTPTTPLAKSTRYTVSLAGDLADRTDHFQFAFVHLPLDVSRSWFQDVLATADLAIPFNQPVRPADALAHCSLAAAAGPTAGASVALSIVGAADTPADTVTFHPTAPLLRGQLYTLTCAQLAGAGGNAVADKLAVSLRVHDGLHVEFTPGDHDTDVQPDRLRLSVALNNAAGLDDVRAAIHSTPPIKNLDQGSLSYDGSTYEVYVDLDAQTDYTISIDGSLADLAGDKLGDTATAHFKTGSARGRLAMERGIYAVEASAKGYPLFSRNLPHYSIACAAIPQDKLVTLLTGKFDLDGWSYDKDDKPLAWDQLGVSPRRVDRTIKTNNAWNRDELDLGATCGAGSGRRGVYLVDVTSDALQPDPDRPWLRVDRNRVVANVTDLGVLVEAGASSGLVWVTSLATAAPVAGATVTLYDPNSKRAVFTGTSDANGIVRVPGTDTLIKRQNGNNPEDPELDWEYQYGGHRLVAVVQHAGDLAVVDGSWQSGIQLWNFGLSEDSYSSNPTRVRGFIESDRGLYRPGEKVHFKGIVREIAPGGGPRPPARKPVHVDIVDSRGASVLSTDTAMSAFGGFAFDLGLSTDASLGDYHVTATADGQRFDERFAVQEFRPAAFELALSAKDPRPEALSFDLAASYLFGAPLPDAKVAWSVNKRPHHVAFPAFEEYTFADDPHAYWWAYRGGTYGEQVGNGEGTTDDHGHLVIDQADTNRGDGPIDYVVSASVTDAANQTIEKSSVVTSHQTSLYLGLHADDYVAEVGTPLAVDLVAVDPDGARVASKAHLQLIHTTWQCLWEDHAYRAYQHCDSADKVASERDVDIAAAGTIAERLAVDAPGEYIVKVTAKDAHGRDVTAATELWAIGKGQAWWGNDDGDRMSVIASKPRYQVGDTARLVAMANLVQPTTLVTIERDGVLDARVVKLANASEGVTMPIKDTWAPDVYASIAMVSGRHGSADKDRPQFKMGVVELKVAVEHKQLNIAVELDRDHVKPGERVSGKLRVTSGTDPVVAEVALSAADEGVLQLIDYQTPNPLATFYAAYGLGIDASTNWNRISRAIDPDGNDPDQGGDTASRLNAGKVRSKFVASAFWAPMLVTDANGEVAFSFVAPDNLGAFRLMAAAADAGDRFGAGERRLTVSKPVMAVPALPRFLGQSDTADVGVIIHNETDRAGTATVQATAKGATLDGATTRTIALPANGEVAVRFPARAVGEATAATFGFAVVMGNDRDAVQVDVPIEKPRTIQARSLVDGAVADSWTGSLGIGSDVVRADSSLAIAIDRTGVAALQPSLHALVEYPYGCLEQTMSRFVPLLAAKDLAGALDDASLAGTKAEDFIQAGVAKVIRHQQSDGMFSLWPSSQTYPHLTAYALWGLTVAQQQGGEQVPADVFDRGIAALQGWANDPKSLTPGGSGGTMAMAAYVMALRGKPNAGLDARLYAARAGLPMWGKAFLLRAMNLAHADRVQIAELEGQMVGAVTTDGATAQAKETGETGDDFELYWATDARATALVLAALLEVDAKSPLIDKLATGLLGMREGATGAWTSTQDNLWSLVALAQYARRATGADLDATITLGGKVVATKHLRRGMVQALTLPLASITGDDLAIAVNGHAHVTARVIEARVDTGAPASHGYAIQRSYRDEAGKPLTSAKPGQLVTIRLDIDADSDHRWIAVVDPLPAGFEAVNPELASNQPRTDRYGRYQTWWGYVEMRDDRVRWFTDELGRGHVTLSYQARATTPGAFTAAPATVEAMYQPAINGRTGTAAMTVER